MSNPERVSPKTPSVRERRGTGEHTSQCSHCETAVDPLRAARVRILDDRFHYFCSAECAQAYEPRERPTPHPMHPSGEGKRKSDPAEVSNNDALAPAPELDTVPERSPASDSKPPSARKSWVARGKREPLGGDKEASVAVPAATSSTTGQASAVTDTSSAPPMVLLQASVIASALSLLLLLALEGPTTSWIRLGLAAAANLLQAAYLAAYTRHYSWKSEGGQTASTVAWLLGVCTLALAAYSLLTDGTADFGLVSLAGTQHLLWGLSWLATALLETPLEAKRRELAEALQHSVLRVTGELTVPANAGDLRPGEDIVVHAGETIPVDASIVAGSGEASPWLGSEHVREVTTGDTLYAGAKLVSGQVRAVVRWTGNDRHWLRLTNDPQRKADVHAPSVRFSDRVYSRLVPALVLMVAAVGWSQNQPPLAVLAYALSAATVLLGPALPRLVRLEVLHATLTTLKHGIVLANARVFDIAGKVTRAVFCARGTLLLGEPQLSTLEPLGALSNDEILALVAGAEQSSSHPIASSVLRAARAAGILPDAVRNPRSEPGLGVTALAADGRPLVVGSRALMLRERVSVARAEARITELEATGRTVLLVALGGHLSAILSFQDGLRKGARAAVQHLLDASIEPVLLSGDARETCEALAKTLDIDHVRPDVLPADRGKEVERLRGGGAAVAVVGRSPVDDLPLASATLSIALPSQGLQAAGFDIDLASDEVHNAALALRLLHEHRKRVQRLFWLMLGGGILAVFGGVALAIPAGWAPFVSAGCLGVWWLVSSSRTGSSEPRESGTHR